MKPNEFTKGQQPEFDASVEIPKTQFVLNSGDTNTYKFTIETRHGNPYIVTGSDNARAWLFENNEELSKHIDRIHNAAEPL